MDTDDQKHLLDVFGMETSRISSLDSTIFTIKGWAVTLVSALIGFSFTSVPAGGFKINTGLLWVAIVATLIFMIIDIHFRIVQLGNVSTVRKIRNLLIELNTNKLESEDQNVWAVLWKDKHGIGEQDNRKLTIFFRDYFFTILPYGIVVIGLLLLIFL